MADTKAEIERHRAGAQREVDELTKQKESISSHLAQISQLLGTQMPGLADALKPRQAVGTGQKAVGPAPAQAAPGQAGPPQAAPAAPPRNGGSTQAAPATQVSQAAPAAGQAAPRQQTQAAPAQQATQAGQPPAAKQPVSAKAKASNDEEWWTE